MKQLLSLLSLMLFVAVGATSCAQGDKPSSNEIWYTTTDGNIVYPKLGALGSHIISNTYSNGKGVIIVEGDNIEKIGNGAFYECDSLTSITIPDSVTSIGDSAFEDCDSLTSITIPDSVTSIGDWAFRGCDSLTSLTIPDSDTSVGNWAFDGCSLLKDTYVNITDLAAYATGNTTGEFPGAKHLMIDDTEITELVIPDSVTSIGERAFLDCTSLTSVTIPDSVTSIGHYAFSGCSSLPSITIPDSVTSIGHGAFDGCTSLPSITIPDSVTEIGWYAFRGCTSLTSVTIPDSVTEIGGGAFEDCASLTSITIPDRVTSIGESAFYGCSSLTSIIIPASVTEIGAFAFSDCTSLTTVYCKSTTPPKAEFVEGRDGDDCIYWSAFEDGARWRKIYVPKSSVQMYRMSSGWDEFASIIFAEGTMKSQGNELYPIEIYLIPDISDAEYRAIADNEESIDSPIFDHFYSSSCSWYCGGRVDRVTASSYLSPQGRFSYKPEHAHDFDWESAWVEGVSGDGIGQYLLYEFPSGPRVTTVNILNGYVKTSKAWKENSRVKKLKVYYNNTPIAILNLEDSRSLQSFDIGTVGRLEGRPWTLKFEILEVYRGTKYRDTVISEIYFDGIDVH